MSATSHPARTEATLAPRRPYVTHERPLFFAHRGGAGLAPENTLAAYENGLALGADALELDSYTRDELRRFDAGYRFTPDGGQTYPYRGQGVTIPTLREVFERFPDVRVNIDLKQETPTSGERLWALVQEMSAEDRVMVGAFEPATLVAFRRLTGGRVATAASPREVRNFLLFGVLFRAPHWLRPAYDALQVPEVHRGIRVVSPSSVAAAHSLGLDVHVWTIDDRPTMDRLLEWGVDGLMSDRPDILAEALADHAQLRA
jgi:glycerophosphoryl diester phosphodiesterase